MEQTKNEPKNENKAAPGNGKPKKERKPLTEAQRLKRQKMIVLPAMVLVFIGAMWLIFAPSSGKEQEPGTGGYNIEMPDADKENRRIIGDKAKAYEQGAMEERQENRSRAMQQLGDLFDRETAAADRDSDFDLANPGGTEEAEKPAPKTIQSSAAAYRDLNATLGNFYEQPKNDNAEMDELLERIATLESELESGKERSSTMDEQVALMEKSYELAAKYMGGQNGTQAAAGQTAEPSPVQKAGKNTAKPVRQVTHQVVSSLGQPVSNAEFVASFSQERNRSFNTAVGITTVSDRNTIPACVYGAQSVTDGQAVRLRLLEPMAVADRIIPRNAVVVGAAKIQGERLAIEITSLEHDGTVIPVELEVYDTDGQPGIFIPNSMEMNAVREVAANMGGSLGSSINISTNAGAQLASDLGKGLIQGTSQYIAKKMRTVKVHLKAGYRVMLYQETKEVYPQKEADGDLYHGLTRKLGFDRMVPPHGLEVTYDKTVHVIFPAEVRYVDLGSPDLIAGKAEGAENVIRVKATVRNFPNETNMSVITEDGSFYTFNVKYAAEPLLLNVEMCDFIHDGEAVNRPNNAQEIYLKELGSESPMLVRLIMKSIHKQNKREVKHIGCKRFGIQYLLKGIYTHNGLLYFHTEIRNQSNVPFDVDYITWKIVDKKVMKRTAVQERIILPLRAQNYATLVPGKKSERTVFTMAKFTIPDGKCLVVELNEKNGGRHQSFVIENEDLVRANTINELQVR